MQRVLIRNGDEIPDSFGALRTARKKTLVRVRAPNGPREEFVKTWGTQEAVSGEDLVLISDADPEGYPCKLDVFEKTYRETEPGSGLFRKTGLSRLVQVPKGVTAELETLETPQRPLTVEHPDYVVVGPRNEVYANRQDWVEENLEFVD
jgi:hypothetical protein